MSAKMQAMLTKVPLTLGDSCFVMDLATEIPAEEWRDRPVVSRHGGVPVKLAKHINGRKAQ